jgi:hypothetical protein
MNGTLKSWAVPKGPPYDLNERRLAMAVETTGKENFTFISTEKSSKESGFS